MRKKKLILYMLVFAFFLSCLIILNNKYDRFYRIHGMTNEIRSKIERYLDQDEQDYLIQNAFPVESFLRFIELRDFRLYDLDYYHQVEKHFHSKEDPAWTVAYTDQVLTKIRDHSTSHVDRVFSTLMEHDLCDIFLSSASFNIDAMDLYITFQTKQPLTETDVVLLNHLSDAYASLSLPQEDVIQLLKSHLGAYRLQDLVFYADELQKNPNLQLVKKPSTLTTILTPETTVASYEPATMEIPYDVSRMNFAMYLRKDACKALTELNEALNDATMDETLLLLEGFISVDEMDETTDREAQLGLSIEVMSLGILYEQFETTQVYQFLLDHGHEYGFIQRYEDNAHIFRYVGKDVAKLLREERMSLEAYEGMTDEQQ